MFTLFPCITAVHNLDADICIPPDVIIGQLNGSVQGNKMRSERFGILQKYFHQELAKSNSDCAGSKHYVPGSFIAFPEQFLENPLVIDSYIINNNQQILIQVQEKSDLPIIGLQSSICVQHM